MKETGDTLMNTYLIQPPVQQPQQQLGWQAIALVSS
jgi:hypothetical protein